jgi:hypothetical protein
MSGSICDDVPAFLTAQHEHIDLLIARLRAQPDQPALVAELVEYVSAHLAVEHELLLPALRDQISAAVYAELLLEQQELKRALANLLWLDADDARFFATLALTESLFVGHAAYQHEELFDRLAPVPTYVARAA